MIFGIMEIFLAGFAFGMENLQARSFIVIETSTDAKPLYESGTGTCGRIANSHEKGKPFPGAAPVLAHSVITSYSIHYTKLYECIAAVQSADVRAVAA